MINKIIPMSPIINWINDDQKNKRLRRIIDSIKGTWPHKPHDMK